MQASSWHLMQDGVVFFNVNHQGSPRGGDELAVQNWWMGMAERPAGSGRLRFTLMLSLEPATLGRRWLSRDLPGRRNARRPAAHRSAASARLPHAGRGRLADAARARLLADACRRAGRRAGARPGDVHAPGVGVRESHRTARPSHVRFHAHRDGRPHRRARPRPLAGRRLASFTAASRTSSAGISWIPARSTRGRCADGSGRPARGRCRRRTAS